MSLAIPVGLCPTTIGVTAAWWLDAARRAEEAGAHGVWAWDHFLSRGRRTTPVLECWTLLAATAVATRRVRLGSFVTNVMSRHPALLGRMAATVADLAPGRLELGVGIGGWAEELEAYGMPFPAPAERAARLEEAVTVLRLLFAGGPADHEGRSFRLSGAHAFPAPDPPPRIVVAGATPAGARLAARVGDAWTCPAAKVATLLPAFRATLAEHGRREADVALIVGVSVEEVIDSPDEAAARWKERGASELVVDWVRSRQLGPLLEAIARAA
jgi:alkanesulfonate monooxygenase SsuD/methylene tetrahydromethanopterin reductase-like flavin-dependent oxidoreductase (luciferase family)